MAIYSVNYVIQRLVPAPFFGYKKGALCFYCLRFLLRHA